MTNIKETVKLLSGCRIILYTSRAS